MIEILNRKNKTKVQCKLMLHRSMGRYVKKRKSGRLAIDKAKVAQDEKLDGKYLLSTSAVGRRYCHGLITAA